MQMILAFFIYSDASTNNAETAAHLVDQVIPRVPVRQWVLSFPIPLRILFAAHPDLLAPVLRIIHRFIARFLLKQAGVKGTAADTGAVTLIQRFGSAANLNIHLHCLVLDGVYRRTEGEPDFQAARAPSRPELEGLVEKIIARLMKMLTRQGYLVEEQGMTSIADKSPQVIASRLVHLLHRAGAERRTEDAEPANGGRPRRENHCSPVRRCARVQPACRGTLWRASAQGTRTAVPLHHPPRYRQRTAQARWRW